jgi:transposase
MLHLVRYNDYGYHTTEDAVAGGVGQEGHGDFLSIASCLFQPVQPQGFYSAAAFRFDGAGGLSQTRSSGHHSRRCRLVGCTQRIGIEEGAALVHSLQGAAASAKKSWFHRLLATVIAQAKACGLVGTKEQASVDSTGLEAGGRSAHYAYRTGQKRYKLRRWPKLSLTCHNATHLLIGIFLSDGPSQDAPLLAPLLRDTCQRVNIDCLLADGGYDSEFNHAFAREQMGIRSTVIKPNKRGGRRWPRAKYRRQMYRCFAVRKYRQRVQAESAISRFKRNLSPVLRGRSRRTQRIEIHLRVITHDLMLLA